MADTSSYWCHSMTGCDSIHDSAFNIGSNSDEVSAENGLAPGKGSTIIATRLLSQGIDSAMDRASSVQILLYEPTSNSTNDTPRNSNSVSYHQAIASLQKSTISDDDSDLSSPEGHYLVRTNHNDGYHPEDVLFDVDEAHEDHGEPSFNGQTYIMTGTPLLSSVSNRLQSGVIRNVRESTPTQRYRTRTARRSALQQIQSTTSDNSNANPFTSFDLLAPGPYVVSGSKKTTSDNLDVIAIESVPSPSDSIRRVKSTSDLDHEYYNFGTRGELWATNMSVIAPTSGFPAIQCVAQPRLDQQNAAVIIQRFYRLYRMRVHFSSIIQQVTSSSALLHYDAPLPTAVPQNDEESNWKVSNSTSNPVNLNEPTSNEKPMHSRFEHNKPLVKPSRMTNVDQQAAENSFSPCVSSVDITTGALSVQEKIVRRCINEFNADANKGIKNLIHSGRLQEAPGDIAKFLLQESRLSKTKIGEYLGIGEDLPIKVLHEFVELLDFSNLTFDSALRRLLATFRLPGEAQKIDRIMNEFAKRFCANNPGVFTSADTAYVLAYSLIMLNTDAHNPNVKKKMSLQDFLRNNRGIDNKRDLPEDFMKQLYYNIVNDEIKLNGGDNISETKSMIRQIVGLPDKCEDFAIPQRRFVRDFNAHQVPDLSKPNAHRHERKIFLFNDLMFVTKPRQPFSAPSETLAARYQFRYLFNFVTMKAADLPNNIYHQNTVELVNENGRLITLAFFTTEEKQLFLRLIREFIEEVTDAEEEKKRKLQSIVDARVSTTKTVIEKTYDDLDQNDDTKNTPRYRKYGSLRNARLALQAQTSFLFGKQKAKHVNQEGADVKLADFRTTVRLSTPSPSPELHVPIESVGNYVTSQPVTSEISDHTKQETETSTKNVEAEGFTPEPLPTKLRKRRHTTAGFSVKKK